MRSAKRRQVRAETGLSPKQFVYFKELYREELKKYDNEIGLHSNNKRPGRPSTLDPDKQAKLILSYLKTYMGFDVLGSFFRVSKSCAHRYVEKGLIIVERILRRCNVMPKLDTELTSKQLNRKYRSKDKLFLDGVERGIRRPTRNQKDYYSGKKKAHTTKNLVLTDERNVIVVITPTVMGKKHDFAMFKESNLGNIIPNKCDLYVDLGFLGIEDKYSGHIKIPFKKPKDEELTKLQKRKNRAISKVRVKVEHAIGGVKRLNSAKNIYRGIKTEIRDKIMGICAGLWNFHIMCKNKSID